jgi:hypothetical protein
LVILKEFSIKGRTRPCPISNNLWPEGQSIGLESQRLQARALLCSLVYAVSANKN